MGKENKVTFIGRTFSMRIVGIVILIISGVGFVAGFINNSINDAAATAYDNLSRSNQLAVLKVDKANQLINYDWDRTMKAYNELAWAKHNLNELIKILNDPTFSNDTKYLQNSSLISRTIARIEVAFNYLMLDTWIQTTLYDHFVVNNETLPYDFTTTDLDGYNYAITRTQFLSRLTDLGDEYNASELLMSEDFFFNETTWADHQEILDYLLLRMGELEMGRWQFLSFWAISELYNLPAIEEREIGLVYQENYKDQSALGMKVAQGVSLTTVAIVLASSMSTRVDARHNESNLSEIYAGVMKDDKFIEKESDPLALIISLVACALAVGGLVLAII